MIFQKLVFQFLRHGDDPDFYRLQARDTVRWLESVGIALGDGVAALDLGCGHGMIGAELATRGCAVVFADEFNCLSPAYSEAEFRQIDIDTADLGILGQYDLVICSNVLEHIPSPDLLIGFIDRLLKPGGRLYLSWTNWLSPWGGHDFSPFHYLGPRHGHLVYDRLFRRERVHTPYVTLFPTSIGGTLKMVRRNPRLRVLSVVPRYYPEFASITRIPVLREFLAWNCVIMLEKPDG